MITFIKKIQPVTCFIVICTFCLIQNSTPHHSALANQSSSNLPIVHVTPANTTDPTLKPQNNFTIELRISNITDLYGFDIQLSWDTTILNYTSHEVKVPVESHIGGILHQPVLPIMDVVNATAGTYVVVYSSLNAPSFNGSGAVFTMSFTIIDYGECILDIYHHDLSNKKGQPISHITQNGYFNNQFFDVAIVNVTSSSLNAFIGEIVNITVKALNNGTSRNESFNVTTYYTMNPIGRHSIIDLSPNTTQTTIFQWNTTGAIPGSYTISANASYVSKEKILHNNKYIDGAITLTIEPIHDISILALTPLKTLVFEGFCLSANITLENQGNFQETFNFTLYANNTQIQQTQLTLARDEIRTLEFSWNTTNAVEYHPYLLNATVNWVVGENDTSDNNLIYAGINITHPGDIDVDKDVDIFDIVPFGRAYGSIIGNPLYSANLDVDCDGDIDIFDIVAVAKHYGYGK